MTLHHFRGGLFCVAILIAGGCTTEETPPAAETKTPRLSEPNKNAVATAPPAPTELKTMAAEAAEDTAANWIAPYMNDNLTAVCLVDLRRMDAITPHLPRLLQFVNSTEEDLSGLRQFELLAFLWTAAPNNAELPSKRIAVIGRCQESPDDRAVSAIKALARMAIGRELQDWDMDWKDHEHEGSPYLPLTQAEGNTLFAAPRSYLERVIHARNDSPQLADTLRSAGQHAVIHYEAVDLAIKQYLREIKDELFDPELKRPLESMVAQDRLDFVRKATLCRVDFSPTLSVEATLFPDQAIAPSRLLSVANEFVESFTDPDQLQQIKEQKFHLLDAWMICNVREPILSQGKLAATDDAVTFRWTATPEVGNELLARALEFDEELKKVSQAQLAVKRMRMVANGILLYMDRNDGRFPQNICDENGKPLMSWRVQLMPVIELQTAWKQLHMDEPWDSPHNAKILEGLSGMFRSHPDTPPGHADILAVVGEPKMGFLVDDFKDEPPTMDSLKDGLAFTALAVQVSPDKSVPWAKPDDFHWNPDKPGEGLGAADQDWFYAVFGDTRAVKVSRRESAATLRRLFGRENGRADDLKTVEDKSP